METRRLIVQEVISPGTIRGEDGQTYVLKGIPDAEEGWGNLAAARQVVEKMLLHKEILINEDTAKELPDLPGIEVEAFGTDSAPMTPYLASRVAGALVNHPIG